MTMGLATFGRTRQDNNASAWQNENPDGGSRWRRLVRCNIGFNENRRRFEGYTLIGKYQAPEHRRSAAYQLAGKYAWGVGRK
jgi:hypothetical protein